MAGPAAIISWVIGGVLHRAAGPGARRARRRCTRVSGGTARFPHYAFGGVAGASFGWFSWLQAATVAPIEVSAMLTYMGDYAVRQRLDEPRDGVLTHTGLVVAIILMALFAAINFLGVRQLAHDQQRDHLVEGRRPAAARSSCSRWRQLRHRATSRRRRLRPRGPQGHPAAPSRPAASSSATSASSRPTSWPVRRRTPSATSRWRSSARS